MIFVIPEGRERDLAVILNAARHYLREQGKVLRQVGGRKDPNAKWALEYADKADDLFYEYARQQKQEGDNDVTAGPE